MIWKVTLDIQKYFQILMQECSKPEKVACLENHTLPIGHLQVLKNLFPWKKPQTYWCLLMVHVVYFLHVNKRERETLADCCHLSVLSIKNEIEIRGTIAAEVLDLDYENCILILVF